MLEGKFAIRGHEREETPCDFHLITMLKMIYNFSSFRGLRNSSEIYKKKKKVSSSKITAEQIMKKKIHMMCMCVQSRQIIMLT